MGELGRTPPRVRGARLGSIEETLQLGLEGAQAMDFSVDLREVLANELLGVTAWALAAIHDLEEVPYFSKPEADALCTADEAQTLYCSLLVESIASWAAVGHRQHADPVVIADRMGTHGRLLSQFGDGQLGHQSERKPVSALEGQALQRSVWRPRDTCDAPNVVGPDLPALQRRI
jgi:hypothetical protein